MTHTIETWVAGLGGIINNEFSEQITHLKMYGVPWNLPGTTVNDDFPIIPIWMFPVSMSQNF